MRIKPHEVANELYKTDSFIDRAQKLSKNTIAAVHFNNIEGLRLESRFSVQITSSDRFLEFSEGYYLYIEKDEGRTFPYRIYFKELNVKFYI